MKIIASLAGILLATVGGVVAYRAAFVAPRAAVVITQTGVREMPDMWRILAGIALLVAGTCLAFFALRPPRRP
ncbi:MAG TPA: hypothetical protein VGX24_08680 [Pyrinomonadaceae bacterium]|jgi:hypothetical protein|nr:hypothetical protein [Pyrinomonadaceae bacterium]